MSQFAASGVLLDIEGTTSSISFVYDMMFPYARRELDAYLASHWRTPECRAACEQIARDAGYPSLAAWAGEGTNELGLQTLVRGEVHRLMDSDSKATGLKELQGLIWKKGFESGEMQAHVFDDVPPALLRWNANGIDVRIYSSGSIAAQKLFFGHTQFGDLLKQFQGHYDTTTGPKREASSYTKIAAAYGLPPAEIVFISDVVAELDAARTAGMLTCLCLRPGNKDVSPDQPHLAASSFTQLELV
jgi:enolase-phosphatase E1